MSGHGKRETILRANATRWRDRVGADMATATGRVPRSPASLAGAGRETARAPGKRRRGAWRVIPACRCRPPPKTPSASRAFLRSPEPKSPDRHRSIERRRRLAASGPMPPALACRYTVGELAVLRIVADEVIARGTCDRSLAEIAARAGVCRKLAQLTLRMAARDGLIVVERRPRPGRKNLTNVVRIISQAWLAWMRHRNHRPSGDRVHGGQGENLYLPRAQVLGRGLAKGAQSGHGRPATAAVPRYRPRKCPSGA
jgi:hypothetical protein